MRIYTLPAVIASAIVLTGCGPESTSGNPPRNPAEDVNQTVESFTVRDVKGLAPVVPNTIFYDFYRGLEPFNVGDDQNTAAALRGRLDELMGLTPSEDGKTYVAARNPLDFLNNTIASNRVENFNEGRRLMLTTAETAIPARYNNRAKGKTIRFTESSDDGNNNASTEEKVWVFPTLDWTSIPQTNSDPQDDRVGSFRQFIARTPTDESEAQPEVLSNGLELNFALAEFSVSGHNRPEFAIFTQTARTLGDLELRKEYIDNRTDTMFLVGPPPEGASEMACNGDNLPPAQPLDITIAGENPDCVRVEVDYADSQVRVFTSRGEAVLTEDCEAFNTNYCGAQSTENDQEAVSYQGITISSRQ